MGGLIATYASWRWVFYLNLPFGLAAAYLVAGAYRDGPRARGKLALGPALAFAAASGLAILGLEGASPLALVGLFLLLPAFRYQAKGDPPLLPPLLREPIPRVAFLGNLLAGAAYFGSVAYVPLFAHARGAGPTTQGLLLTPMTVGWTLASIAASRILLRAGVGRLTLLGFGLLTLGLLGYALAPGWPLILAAPFGFLAGVGMGFSMLTLLLAAQERTPKEELGALTSALVFARSLSGAAGVALLRGVLGERIQSTGTVLAHALGQAFLLASALAFTAFLLAWRLLRERGLEAGRPRG
ncbi:hypothetical protein GCM10007092_03010 [Thermus composti]|uniref:MFS transporter n=1 Tax=Thermus composti TaxID=532059 RepID=A0ABV6Q124_9DEIN|nr:MFS transporter [Thermus composti]GGM93206.1 hypothetical protein GCM10007092_03010 [Thermus composti]